MRPSLFIGIGGTGVKAILRTKALLLDTYGKDGALPQCFSFFCIDTDQFAFDKSIMSKTTGQVRLTPSEIFDANVLYYQCHRDDMTWIPKQNVNHITSLRHGSCAVRTNGRLAFVYYMDAIKYNLRGKLESMMHCNVRCNLNCNFTSIDVHIVSSLCGGTGSGMFIDMAYLLRELSSELNIPIFINGYGVMPGIFMNNGTLDPAHHRWQANTYAALHELDYLMSSPTVERNGVKMPWMNDGTRKRPFDYFSLIDNVNASGLKTSALSDIVDVLSYQLVQDVASDPIYRYKAWLKTHPHHFDMGGKHAWVSSVGVSAIKYNADRVAQFYGLMLQCNLLVKLLNDFPADIDVMRWVRSCVSLESGSDYVLNALYDMQRLIPFRVPTTINRRHFNEDVRVEMEKYEHAYSLPTEEWSVRVDRLYEETKSLLKTAEEQASHKSLGVVLALLEEVKHQIEDLLLPEMNEQLVILQRKHEEFHRSFELTMEDTVEYLGRIFPLPTIKEMYICAVSDKYNRYICSKFEMQRHNVAISFYHRLLNFIHQELARFYHIKDIFLCIRRDNTNEMNKILNLCDKSFVDVDVAEHVIHEGEMSYNDVSVCDFLSVLPIHMLSGSEGIDTYCTALNNYVSSTPAYANWCAMTVVDVLDAMSEGELKHVVERAVYQSVPFLCIDARYFNDEQDELYVCLPNIGLSRLKEKDYYRDVVGKCTTISMSTELQDCIIIYRQKHPVIALQVEGLQQMVEVCTRMYSTYSAYMDENLRKRMDEEDFELYPWYPSDKLVAWTVGCVLGLIKEEEDVYWYRDATQDGNWVNTFAADRAVVFEKFCANRDIVERYVQIFSEFIEGMDKAQRKLFGQDVRENYVAKYSRCHLIKEIVETVHRHVKTKELLEMERKCIRHILSLL